MILTETGYVAKAENVMKSIVVKDRNGKSKIELTTSKIRNLLSMISDIYNDVTHVSEDHLSDDIISRIQYLKMRFAYEAGREREVMNLVEKAEIFQALDEIGNDRKQLILFCHYMEALVAYRKFYGEKDD